MNRTHLRHGRRIICNSALSRTTNITKDNAKRGHYCATRWIHNSPRRPMPHNPSLSHLRFPFFHQRYMSSNRRRKFSSSTTEAIQVTRTSPISNTGAASSSSSPYDLEKEQLTSFVDDLLHRTRSLMDNDDINNNSNNNNNNTLEGRKSAHHVIAFSGGIDSSVATALIHRVVDLSSSSSLVSGVYGNGSETVTAVLGLSPAVPADQRLLAEEVASVIGVALEQVSTTEGTDEVYLANDGRACLACKTHLYDNLRSIVDKYCATTTASTLTSTSTSISARSSSAAAAATIMMDTILYNGTNADDLKDPTRLGLIAAQDYDVRSPLRGLPKHRVRAVGKHLGLPNWDYAASPCLRSRLAVGVTATSDRLKNVGLAEAFIRESLFLGKEQGQHQNENENTWDNRKSLRVRILSKNRAMIEVDDDKILEDIEGFLPTKLWKTYFEDNLGFAQVGVRKFKTGSVAPTVIPKQNPNRVATITSASPTDGVVRTTKLRRRP